MKEQFVTYEIALSIKELGFDEPCFAYFRETEFHFAININDRIISRLFVSRSSSDLSNVDCIAPLWQQVIDWFREKYKLYVNIEPKITKEWEFSISELNKGLLFGNKSLYINKNLDYYKAREQAILKCIELCQNKK